MIVICQQFQSFHPIQLIKYYNYVLGAIETRLDDNGNRVVVETLI